MRLEEIDENTIRATLAYSRRTYRLEETGEGRWDLRQSNRRIGTLRQTSGGFRVSIAIGGETLTGTFPTRDEALGSAAELCEWRKERPRLRDMMRRIEQEIEGLEQRIKNPAGSNYGWLGVENFFLGIPDVDDDLKVEILTRRLPKLAGAIDRVDAGFERVFRPAGI